MSDSGRYLIYPGIAICLLVLLCHPIEIGRQEWRLYRFVWAWRLGLETKESGALVCVFVCLSVYYRGRERERIKNNIRDTLLTVVIFVRRRENIYNTEMKGSLFWCREKKNYRRDIQGYCKVPFIVENHNKTSTIRLHLTFECTIVQGHLCVCNTGHFY